MTMVRFWTFLLGATLAAASASAQEATKFTLTNEQLAGLITAFKALDHHLVIIKDGENQRAIDQVYKFGAQVRATLGKNAVAAGKAFESFQAATQQIMWEISNGIGRLDPASSDPKEQERVARYTKQATAIALEKVDVSLIPLARGDLKLDVNEIPLATLAQLDPILRD